MAPQGSATKRKKNIINNDNIIHWKKKMCASWFVKHHRRLFEMDFLKFLVELLMQETIGTEQTTLNRKKAHLG